MRLNRARPAPDTAGAAAGPSGVEWFAGMPDWSGFLIEDETAHHFGPAFDLTLRLADTIDSGAHA